jgi:hypothetical protein
MTSNRTALRVRSISASLPAKGPYERQVIILQGVSGVNNVHARPLFRPQKTGCLHGVYGPQLPASTKILSSGRSKAGGQVIRAHPEALRNFPDRVLPLRHLPDRLRADNDVYCLLDMDNSSGGRRWPTPAGTSLPWGVKHVGINAERRYCMSQVNAEDRSANL